MTTIGLLANGQSLTVELNPTVSSGGCNTVEVHVDFRDDWDGFSKSAVFFTSLNKNAIYEIVMTDGKCIVPAEVMKKECMLFIGIRGVNSNNNEVKTTSLVKYKISEGTPSGTGIPVEPTPDVYQQLLTAYEKTNNAISVERARIDNLSTLTEGSTTGDAELQDIRVGADGKIYDNAGAAVRGQIGDIGKELRNFEKTTVSGIREWRKHQVGKYTAPNIHGSFTDHAVNSIAYPPGKYRVLYLVSDTARYSYVAEDINGKYITGNTYLTEDTVFESEYDFYISLRKSHHPVGQGDITDSDLAFIDDNFVVTRIINENGNTLEDRVKELEGSALSLDETLMDPAKAAPADAVGKLKEDIANIGNPTDEQVSTAVNNYLDKNPVSGLDASTAQENQVPTADGQGNWSWKTQQGGAGNDGYSPTATVKQTANGVTISITDKNGTTTADVLNGSKGDKGDKGDKGETGEQGPQGEKGETGEAGTSVTIQSVTESTEDGGSNIVTFSDGKTLTVRNGSKGDKGESGTGSGAIDTYYVTPEQYGAIGDGSTDDSEAFRQAIETEKPIVCTYGKKYNCITEIVTEKTTINIIGNRCMLKNFHLKINVNSGETSWINAYPVPNSTIQDVNFNGTDKPEYCIKTGIPIKFLNCKWDFYDIMVKNYGSYMDYIVFENCAFKNHSGTHYAIDLAYLGDQHVFRECDFGGTGENRKFVSLSGCQSATIINCLFAGDHIIYSSNVVFIGCHMEGVSSITVGGDKTWDTILHFIDCYFWDMYTLSLAKSSSFFDSCTFYISHQCIVGGRDYASYNQKNCKILCATTSDPNSYVNLDDLVNRKEFPEIKALSNRCVYQSSKGAVAQGRNWPLNTGSYTYLFFPSTNPYSIDGWNFYYTKATLTFEISSDSSIVSFTGNSDFAGYYLWCYRTSPDGTIHRAIMPMHMDRFYDYGQYLNGVHWVEVSEIPNPDTSLATLRNGIYYSSDGSCNGKNCMCVNTSNGVVSYISEDGVVHKNEYVDASEVMY